MLLSDNMSYHFKYIDLVNKKAFKYLDDGNGDLDIEKFIKWWFCSLTELKEFNKDSI